MRSKGTRVFSSGALAVMSGVYMHLRPQLFSCNRGLVAAYINAAECVYECNVRTIMNL